MITVAAAFQTLEEHITDFGKERKSLIEAMDSFSAEDLYAPMDVPPFDNAAMDGYCFRFRDYAEKGPLNIIGDIPAGDIQTKHLPPGAAYGIYTGAPLPRNADTVVMQEHCKADNGMLYIQENTEKEGTHIRKQGSQTAKGALLLKKHTKITPAIVAFLATFGITEITVFRKPAIGILVTGKELVAAPHPLQHGQIYESNAITLSAFLQKNNIPLLWQQHAGDDIRHITERIKEGLSLCDILIITGGISVGAYDYVREALTSCAVAEIFYKVRQKPGKPLYFGAQGAKKIWALPGNPASVLSCFLVYVRPFIDKCSGSGNTFFFKEYLPLIHDYYEKNTTLTRFLKASISKTGLQISNKQFSYQMDAFAQANALAMLPTGKDYFPKGSLIAFKKI